MNDEMGMGGRMREMVFGEGLGWSAVGKNLGKEVHVYLTLKIIFFVGR